MITTKLRKAHKWLMTFIGIQFLVWSITGLYMVSMDIHFIHGEPLKQQPLNTLELDKVTYSLSDLLSEYPQAQNIQLGRLLDKQVYRIDESQSGKLILDASTGEPLGNIDENMAKRIAKHRYTGTHDIQSIQLLSKPEQVPSELSARHLPVWQVTFSNPFADTFYINQYSGELVTTRHHFWRLFDWMWRFHIMDYDDGENVANWLLLMIALLGSLAATLGLLLTYQRVFKTSQGAS
ncbi:MULTISPECIES: hypothetical protein [Pseudoalteromonas]|uniref:Peptidase n=1 Tax=Pseudoalteromonas amylolytica TaxID=1859457 RepID=A0A1S1N058_9GAMM|nr:MULTISPECIES: hypothetical protein [Pseudoalteromonas]OHU90541.1 hypothetical protein BFC16_02740 [Pseudoalteromonas sp. JW3]OHU92837.1 hypothetical protein BET10_05155 [Pseudoalteromonas amylolytica]